MTGYRELVKSLKRLYENGRITIERVDQIYQAKTITKEEYDYILGRSE